MDRHVHHPSEPSLAGDPDRFAKAANLLTMTPAAKDTVSLVSHYGKTRDTMSFFVSFKVAAP
jgi:hypothetical protein